MSPWFLHLGAALYGVNLAVGLSARVRGTHFGRMHHWLYGLVFAAAIAAAIFARHPALLLTLVSLALMPATKPRSAGHPALAIVGALGYVGTYLL